MSWKHLKTLAIAILLLMNTVFLVLILRRDRVSTHYDSALIDSAISVFHQSELYVNRSMLDVKMSSFPVYTGEIETENAHMTAAIRAIEEAGFTLSDEPGGIRLKNPVGEFYFADDFGFYYSENGRYERPSSLLRTERYILLSETAVYRAQALAAVDAFLEKYDLLSASGGGYGFEVAYSAVYSSGVNYIVTLSQSIDGIPVHEEITVMVSGGRVVSADGVFATAVPTEKRKAECIDLLGILFLEKAHLDEEFRAGGSFSYKPMVVSEISYSYAVYFDAAERFYLVPLCEICYVNGESRTYNCISGKLYS